MAGKVFHCILVLTVLLCLLTQETEARRKILRGRKTVTRTYASESALPAWAWVVIVAFGELIAGGIIFLIMKKKILDPPISGSYSVQNA